MAQAAAPILDSTKARKAQSEQISRWIDWMRCYWEERLDAMERLLCELKKDHELERKDRKRGSR